MSQPPSSSTIIILKSTYLAMLFTFPVMQTASSVRYPKINNIAKEVVFANHGDKKLKFGLFHSGEDVEHSGIEFIEISKIFAMQTDFFLWGRIM